MQKVSIVAFVGLVLASSLVAEPLVEGRVRLSSGEAVTAAQVMVFDLAALQRGPVAQVTTDADGHFALPLAALGGPVVPQGFALGQNYPNPFNPSTIIPYQLPTATHVRLEVFNVLGQRVATLVNEERPAGFHAARWDATDAAGQAVAAGVYIYRLRGAGMALTRRLVLVDGQAGTATVSAAGGAAVNALSELAEQTYGIVVSGEGVVPYVDEAFAVRAGMRPVEFVVQSVGELPRGKALTCGILGDVNNDGRVDLGDALLVVVFNLDPSIVAPNNGNIGLGDVTDDGQVNLDDLLAIMTYIANSSDASLPTGIEQTATRVNWVAGPIRRLTHSRASDRSPTWSPDGTQIAFHSYRDGDWDIFVMNADGTNRRRLTHSSASDAFPAWSPDGTQITFHSHRYGDWDVFVMNANGTNLRRLTDNNASDRSPTWSPDGTQIAFVSDRAGNDEIYVMDADGEDEYLRRLTDNSASDRSPTWSPDGRRIAFRSYRDGDWDIFVMNANGTNLRRLTHSWASDQSPAWPPDGTQIAFQSSRDGDWDIFVMNANGTNLRRLTNNSASDQAPAWSPGGTQIAFHYDRGAANDEWDDWDIYVMDLLGGCE